LPASKGCVDWCDAREVCGRSTANVNVKEYIFMCCSGVQGNGSFAMYREGCYESSFSLGCS
jgi:hypothetical protein